MQIIRVFLLGCLLLLLPACTEYAGNDPGYDGYDYVPTYPNYFPKDAGDYEPPAKGPTAEITYATKSADHALFVYVYSEGQDCKGLKSVGNGALSGKPKTFRVKAGRELTLKLFSFGDHSDCDYDLRFTPVAGGEYAVLSESDKDHYRFKMGRIERDANGKPVRAKEIEIKWQEGRCRS